MEENVMKLKLTTALVVVLMLALLNPAGLIAREKKITLATLEWEPYVGSTMAQNGFTAEIVVAAFKHSGYQVEIIFHPWVDTLALGQAGKVDGIFPAYHSRQREDHFVFSEPFAVSPLGFYKKSSAVAGPNIAQLRRAEENIVFPGDPRINPNAVLQGMKHYTFGVVKGYVHTPEFDAADYLTKVEAQNDTENLLNLINGRVNLTFIDRYVAKNIIVKKFPWHLQDYEFMMPPLATKPLFLAISLKTVNFRQKLMDFNQGLALAKQDGEIERLMNKYGLQSRF